jgi:mannose-6-phosphate isomerase-like protein (cupin superfamily)
MPPTDDKGYLLRHLRDARTVPSHCGASHRIFTRKKTPPVSLHMTEITDSKRHSHADLTEYYYILEGTGKMELGPDVVDLEPNLAILIRPGTAHRAYGDIKALIIMVPTPAPSQLGQAPA